MKYTYVIVFLFTLCTHHITFSMENYETIELEPIYKTNESTANIISLDEAVATIDKEINKKHSYDFITAFFNLPIEEDFFNTTNTFTKCSILPSDELINKLYKKNKHFKHAIKYFINLARQNLNNVTLATIATIQDSTLIQPTTQLNNLPTHIKKYVMNAAYNEIQHSYDIVLTGHTDKIKFFDLCSSAHRAATCSMDKTVRLWDLKKAALIQILPENDYIDYINFNPDGFHLATLANYDNNTSIIKIWETQTGKLIHTLKLDTPLDSVCYGKNNTLITCNNRKGYYPTLTIFLITNKEIIQQTKIQFPYEVSPSPFKCLCWGNTYKTTNPYIENLGSTLTITKQHCRSLRLCEKAIENIQQLSPDTIEELPIFQVFTEYEQNMLRIKELKRNAPLVRAAELLQRRQSHNNKLLTYK